MKNVLIIYGCKNGDEISWIEYEEEEVNENENLMDFIKEKQKQIESKFKELGYGRYTIDEAFVISEDIMYKYFYSRNNELSLKN